jgi:hypothetical protein
MPLPMVHLAVAVQMHKLLDSTASPDFLLGSIAPDAIHIRAGSGRDDKRRVHLSEFNDPGNERVRAFLEQIGACGKLGFAEGYASHILTDRLWVERFYAFFTNEKTPHLTHEEWRTLYYLETDQIDFDLYHQAPWRSDVWSWLSSAQPKDFGSLLTANEISRWRDRTLIWFDQLKKEPKITPVYFTSTDVQHFIGHAAEKVLEFFKLYWYK